MCMAAGREFENALLLKILQMFQIQLNVIELFFVIVVVVVVDWG